MLRVLMYHKVNDVAGNPLSVPCGVFDEQMSLLGDLGYTVVGLDAVLDHYADGTPLPRAARCSSPSTTATATTSRTRRRSCASTATRRSSSSRSATSTTAGRCRTRSTSPRAASSTRRSTGRSSPSSRRAASASSRTGSRTARSPTSRSTRRRGRSRSRSSVSRSGSAVPVRAFAYVKGSEAHYKPVHLSLLRQAGYEVAFTSVSGANGARDRPAPAAPLQRRALPGAHLRARPRGRLRRDRAEGHGRGHVRAAALQPGARHRDEVSDLQIRDFARSRGHDAFLDLMRARLGRRRDDGRGRVRVVVRAQPGGRGSVAVARGDAAPPRTCSAQALFTLALAGRELLGSFSLHGRPPRRFARARHLPAARVENEEAAAAPAQRRRSRSAPALGTAPLAPRLGYHAFPHAARVGAGAASRAPATPPARPRGGRPRGSRSC